MCVCVCVHSVIQSTQRTQSPRHKNGRNDRYRDVKIHAVCIIMTKEKARPFLVNH